MSKEWSSAAHLKTWYGKNVTTCNVCKATITDNFVDGRTHDGRWAIMCPTCHTQHGVGFGTGCGQEYRRVDAYKGELFAKVCHCKPDPKSRQTYDSATLSWVCDKCGGIVNVEDEAMDNINDGGDSNPAQFSNDA